MPDDYSDLSNLNPYRSTGISAEPDLLPQNLPSYSSAPAAPSPSPPVPQYTAPAGGYPAPGAGAAAAAAPSGLGHALLTNSPLYQLLNAVFGHGTVGAGGWNPPVVQLAQGIGHLFNPPQTWQQNAAGPPRAAQPNDTPPSDTPPGLGNGAPALTPPVNSAGTPNALAGNAQTSMQTAFQAMQDAAIPKFNRPDERLPIGRSQLNMLSPMSGQPGAAARAYTAQYPMGSTLADIMAFNQKVTSGAIPTYQQYAGLPAFNPASLTAAGGPLAQGPAAAPPVPAPGLFQQLPPLPSYPT